MTRKDYVAIAGAVRGAAAEGAFLVNGKAKLLAQLCAALKGDNAAFNEALFIKACGGL